MRLSGHRWKYFILFFAALGYSCAGIRIDEFGYFKYDTYTRYYNDSLAISLRLFGDYNGTNKRRQVRKRKSIFKASPLYKSATSILFYGKTTEPPYFECLLLTAESKMDSGLVVLANHESPALRDTVSFFRNRSPVLIGKESFLDQYVARFHGQQFYLLVFATLKNNAGHSLASLLESSRREFRTIVTTMSNNKEYNSQVPVIPFSAMNDAFQSSPSGNYLLPILRLAERRDEWLGDEAMRNFYFQAMATAYCFAGDYKNEFEHLGRWTDQDFNNSFPERRTLALSPNMKTQDVNILPELYSGNRVVMFNESHFEPRHRLFLACQLPALYKAGYRYLAVETLNRDDSLINSRGYPTMKSGYYIREYNMANMIRTALNIGFTLIAYDDMSRNGLDREIAQRKTYMTELF